LRSKLGKVAIKGLFGYPYLRVPQAHTGDATRQAARLVQRHRKGRQAVGRQSLAWDEKGRWSFPKDK